MRTLAPSDPETIHRRRWATLAVLCLSLVLVVVGNSVLNVALPTLVRELDATSTQLQWIVDSYALVFGGLLLTAGALGDRYGRKGALQLGLVIFGCASLVATQVDSPGQLTAVRAVMGVGAAFVMPSTLSILTNVFPPAERGRAIGIWAAFAGVGAAIGPIVGGWLLEHYWWGSIFLMNVPIVILALVAGAVLVPASRDETHTGLDVLGAALSIVALGSLLFGIIEGPERGWADPLTLGAFGLALVSGVSFVVWELRNDHPMLEMRWFRRPGFTVGVSSISLAFFAMFGLFFLLTQYLQFVQGYSALEAGLRVLPLAFALMVAAPNSDRMARRFGIHRVVGGGLMVVAIGLAWLSFVETDTEYWKLAIVLAVLGLGMGSAMAPSTGSIMAALPVNKAGVGSAVNDTSREVGGALGIAILGSILNSGYRSRIDAEIPDVVPEEAREVILDGIGAAFAVAESVPEALATQAAALVDAARVAFTDSMGASILVGAAFALLGSFVAFRFMPPRSEPHGVETPEEVRAELEPVGADE